MNTVKLYFTDKDKKEYAKECDIVRTSLKNRDLYDKNLEEPAKLIKPRQKDLSIAVENKAETEIERLVREINNIKYVILITKANIIISTKQLTTEEKEQFGQVLPCEFWENQDVAELEKADNFFRTAFRAG